MSRKHQTHSTPSLSSSQVSQQHCRSLVTNKLAGSSHPTANPAGICIPTVSIPTEPTITSDVQDSVNGCSADATPANFVVQDISSIPLLHEPSFGISVLQADTVINVVPTASLPAATPPSVYQELTAGPEPSATPSAVPHTAASSQRSNIVIWIWLCALALLTCMNSIIIYTSVFRSLPQPTLVPTVPPSNLFAGAFMSPTDIPSSSLKFHKPTSVKSELIQQLMNQLVEAEDGRMFIPFEAVLAYLSKDSPKSKLTKPQGSATPPSPPDEVDSLGARSLSEDLSRPFSIEPELNKVHDSDSPGQVVFSFKLYSEDLKVEDIPELKLRINEHKLADTFPLEHSKFKLVEHPCVFKETTVAEPSSPTHMHYQQPAPSRQTFAFSPAPRNFSPVAGPRCLSFHSNESRHVSTQQDWN
jgi:hypothetical protein